MKVTSLRYLDAKFHHPSPKIKQIPKNTNGRLAIPAIRGNLIMSWAELMNGLFHCVTSRCHSDKLLTRWIKLLQLLFIIISYTKYNEKKYKQLRTEHSTHNKTK